MQKRWTWMILILISLVALWGCSSDDDPVAPSATTFETVAAAGSTVVNDDATTPGVISASDLKALVDADGVTVIDIRSEDAFIAGHIPGAYLSSLGTLMADLDSGAIPNDKPYVVACYSGQSAGHAKIAMEMVGLEVRSLLFGMSSWSEATRYPWDNATVLADAADCNVLANPETDNNNADLTTHAYPVLSETGNDVVAQRATTMLANGFKGISYEGLMALPEAFVLNYFGEADYEGTGTSGVPGHIPGAFQFTPYQSMGMDQMLSNIPTDIPVVVYCWTGQHSSQITAYLNMLGYDAYSLTYGSNKLFYDDLTAHKWTAGAYNDFDLEYGASATPVFQAIAAVGTPIINDNATTPGVISAAALEPLVTSDAVTVIDIRAPGDFAAGHIPGAINSSLGTLMSDLTDGTIPTGKPYVVACYSGQSAGHAKIAMEMMGYDTSSLLFGMSSWNSATRYPWDNATVLAATPDRNVLTNPETTNNNGDLTGHSYPALSGDAGTAVETAAAAMLTAGFKGISYDGLLALPEVFVLNYFSQADYEGTGTSGVPGHIPGAFQFTPYQSMGMDEMLANIPTDIPVVVYCWTGQHSSQITAYLNMLGYDAYSLTYGSNKLFYDDLTAHKWTAGAYNDFDLEVGGAQTEAFAAVAEAGAAIVNDNATTPGVIAAASLEPLVTADAVTVIDIRAPGDYDAGHIPGAINSSLGTLMSDLTDGTIPTGKPYVVACYSGQSAGHAKIAMEMMGYDASSLLFGMSSWNSATRYPWDNATVLAATPDRNVLTNPETMNNNGNLTVQEFPALAGDAGTAVETAVNAMLADGFRGVSYDQLMALPEAFVLNYFGEADYLGTGTSGVPGHIPGAFQYTPYQSMGWDEMLAYVPTDIPVVVYCWTGQHSSQITAYLNMLGYDAYSLTYGSNKLFYDDLTAHKWTASAYNDFPLEMTPTS